MDSIGTEDIDQDELINYPWNKNAIVIESADISDKADDDQITAAFTSLHFLCNRAFAYPASLFIVYADADDENTPRLIHCLETGGFRKIEDEPDTDVEIEQEDEEEYEYEDDAPVKNRVLFYAYSM